MSTIVVATPKIENSNQIRDMIRRSGQDDSIVICQQGAEILEIVHQQEVYVVICTRRLSDMGYEKLSSLLPAQVNLLLITRDASLTSYSSNVMCLMMPFKADDLMSTIHMLMPTDYYRHRVKPKPVRSEEEKKQIDHAKRLLMERNAMSEPEAFRYLQKTSMDTGRTLLDTAQMILLLQG